MRVLDLDQLPRSLYPQLDSFGLMNGEGGQDIRFIRRFRSSAIPTAEYYAVYAVENGTILSRVEVTRPRFTTVEGTQTLTGIADVSTRPDAVRRGLAGALLKEVHRREAARGFRWSLLWTHRSWGAHRLYERLGYRDIFSPPSALRSLSRRGPAKLPDGYSWRVAHRRDARRLEQLFARSTRGRVGFVPRPPGSLGLKFDLGWRLPENHRLLLHRGQLVGYANLTSGPMHVGANEVLVEFPEHSGPMIDALEMTARGRALSLGSSTFISDSRTELVRRGYAIYPLAHLTLMARALTNDPRPPDDPASTCRDPSFSCHRGDVF